MGLREYRRKRDFRKTPEPSGTKRAARGRARRASPRAEGFHYVIHKHDASRLHYDLRLELDGTLKSWAVPKGPSLDPSEKRLAVHVEDHPLEYAAFEGTIPEGEYGGGPVMIWDRGRWSPHHEPREMYRKGRLGFDLEGKKLQGAFSLVRMGGERGEGGKNWLLIKKKDEASKPLAEGDVLKERPESVASGRDMEQIAAGGGSVWRSNRPASSRARRRGRRPARPAAPPPDPSRLPGAHKASLPERPRFELATLVSDAPEGDDWLHEIKFDGYRAFCRLRRGKASFITRGGLDWTPAFADLAHAAEQLPAREALLDGEIVKLGPGGESDFQALQNSLRLGGKGLTFMVFDLLHLDGYDLTGLPLEARKEALRGLCAGLAGTAAIRYSDHVAGHGPEASHQACRMALEGIVSKRRGRPYRGGRGRDWLKIKCVARQEFVVGGLTQPEGSRTGFGALLVGYHDEDGALRYAGKVGTGFTQATLEDITRRAVRLETDTSPFTPTPPRAIARRARWIRPELVAEVEFTQWTRDGRLRHPTFRGLREDRAPRKITRERPVAVAQVEPEAAGRRGRGQRDSAPAGARLTHPDKVLFPADGITKRDLAAWYAQVADRMLPLAARRPLMLVRCPEGIRGECFFQKHAGASIPEGIERVPIQESAKVGHHMMVTSAQGLVGLVQMGAMEIHLWGTRGEDVEHPDTMVLDLDPDEALPWDEVARAALELRGRLSALGLKSFVKTTGGKGLHVVSPIEPGISWDDLKAFSQGLARQMVADAHDRFTSVMTKSRRKGKIYIDYQRNGRGATFIAPYSTRRREGAPVSAPITWKELQEGIHPAEFTLRTMPERLKRLKRDPWSGYEEARRAITAAMRRRVVTAARAMAGKE